MGDHVPKYIELKYVQSCGKIGYVVGMWKVGLEGTDKLKLTYEKEAIFILKYNLKKSIKNKKSIRVRRRRTRIRGRQPTA